MNLENVDPENDQQTKDQLLSAYEPHLNAIITSMGGFVKTLTGRIPEPRLWGSFVITLLHWLEDEGGRLRPENPEMFEEALEDVVASGWDYLNTH